MKKISRTSRGFTLIELLAVIAIIGLLSGMVIALAGFVKNSKAETKARGDIALLVTKLEEFKTRNGEYPIPEGTGEQEAEAALFNALTGRWTYKTVNGVRTWDKDRASGDVQNRRPFVQDNEVGTETTFDPTKQPTKFLDPWGNAYRYRYGRLVSGKVDKTWDRPGFLLVSAGAKRSVEQPEIDGASVPDSDFFIGSEATTGIFPNNDENAYFEDQYRGDNLTNFGAK